MWGIDAGAALLRTVTILCKALNYLKWLTTASGKRTSQTMCGPEVAAAGVASQKAAAGKLHWSD